MTSGDATAPTLATWLDPEHTHWSFRHADEIVDTRTIARGPKSLPLSPAHDAALLELPFAGTERDYVLGDFIATSGIDSFTVVNGQNLTLEWFAPDVADTDLHLMFSVTKSITALLCGALVGQGLIDTGALVTEYVPAVGDSGFAGATIRNLLDMTAAYAFVEDYTPGPDVRDYRYAAGWYPAPPESPALRGFLASRATDGQHGERFRYLSPTTDLLGWVCSAVTGLHYADALSQYVWIPMGAEADANITVDREGTPRAAGGLSARARDIARLGLLVARGGSDVIPTDFIDDLTRGGDPDHWAKGDFAPWLPGGAYRSNWYQPRTDPDAIMGAGIYGQMLYVDRAREVVVVTQSSWPVADDTTRHNDAYLASQAVARALG